MGRPSDVDRIAQSANGRVKADAGVARLIGGGTERIYLTPPAVPGHVRATSVSRLSWQSIRRCVATWDVARMWTPPTQVARVGRRPRR